MNASRATNPWLFGPARDLLIGCGAWSLPLLALTYAASKTMSASMAFGFYVLALLCNNPHYMATVYRAYGTPKDFAKYRFFTIYVTVLLLLTGAIVYWKPVLLPGIFTTYIVWSPWHYTGQNFGIAMMMARRNGAQPNPGQRNLIYLFFISSFVLWVVDFNVAGSDDPHILSLAIPEAAARPVEAALLVTSVVSGILGMRGMKFQLAAVTIMATQLLWFTAPVMLRVFTNVKLSPLFYSAGMLAFMHCAQYLWVTSYFAQREAGAADWSFPKYYLTLIVGGIALFIPGPWIISRVFGRDLVESLLVFIALVNIHHFILDGAIWKLRDGKIARLLLGSGPAEPEKETMALWKPGPVLRATLAGTILAIGGLDLLQYYLTSDRATLPLLRVAEWVNPQDTRVHFQRAKILRQHGDIAAALQELDRAIALNPYNLPPQSLKGEILAARGENEAAFEQFGRMAALFKPMPMILINDGVFAVNSGHAAEAVAKYKQAIALDPKNIKLHLGLAEALQMTGQADEAARHYSIYIEAVNRSGQMSDPPSQLPLAEMRLAELCLTLKLPDKALFWYHAAAVQAKTVNEPSLSDQCFARLKQLTNAPPASP